MEEEILKNLNDRLDDALIRGRKLLEDEELNRQIEELKQRSEEIIRTHPIKSVVAGVVAGYLIGKLFSSDD